MKKILVLVLISATSIFAQSAGSSGVSFLKNGFGARNVAMSDLGVVGVNDLTALNYNPALLVDSQNPQIMLTHIQSIQDMSTQLVGASFSLFGLPFAFGFNNTSVSDIEVRTIASDVPQSTFNAHYMFGSISTGINVLENISFGITAKYVYENLLSDESSGYVFDFGVSYKNIIEGLNFGASLKNIGSLSELRNEVTKLPTDFRAGASYNFNLQEISSVVSVIGGVQKYIDTDETHAHAGGEVFYDNLIAIRMGYMSGYEAKGLTAGLGVYWQGINFDYAFTPYSYGLGTGHTISLMYTFN